MKKFDYTNLTRRESEYLQIMEVNYLVLNLIGPPGTAKSAIIKSIADKINAEFIDLRLATMDETDLGVFPYLRDEGDYKVNSQAIPEWASMTRDTSKTFVVAFEELNRASKSVRDAALGVLLERRIGPHFVFGDNVLMCATGNLGVDDGTEVEELDTALKSRLVTISHDIPLDEWISSYGNENIHPDVIRYLSANPTHFYPNVKDQDANGHVIVNPRTWTGLSKFMVYHFGKNSRVSEYGNTLNTIASRYIGSKGMTFMKWLRDHSRITVADVLQGKVKDFSQIERENLNEVCGELKSLGILKIETKEMKNVIKLLNSVDADVKYSAVWDIVQSHDGTSQTDASKMFIKEFKKVLEELVKKNEVANTTPAK
jgi:hypothetical protein